jgi:glutaminyl-peptide cyclotransferase
MFGFSATLGLTLLLACPWPSYQASTLGERDLPQLNASDISVLLSTPDPLRNMDPSNPSSHLSKILIPRVCKLRVIICVEVDQGRFGIAGTENNTLVRNYITSTLKALNWHVEEDSFTDNTPIGRKQFTNIIATKDPTASRRVVLSAHFDSKYFSTYPDNQVQRLPNYPVHI